MSIVRDFRAHPVALSALALGTLLLTALTVWMLLGDVVGPNQAVDSGSQDELILAQDDADDDEDTDDQALQQAAIEVTYDAFLSRDPFESIMPPEPVADDPADPSDPSDPTSPTDPSAPTTPTDPDDPSRPADKDDGVCRTGAEAVCEGTVVVVTAVSTEAATIEVNGIPFTVVPGQSFATNFTLLRIDGTCVDLLYLDGDEADTFRQCVGGATSVK